MHDLKFIRENPAAFDAGLARRGLPAMAADIIALDADARAATARLNELQTRRNAASKAIGAAKGRGDEAEAQRLMAEVEAIKAEMPGAEEAERSIRSRVDHLLAELPNLPAADTPDGRSEEENVEIRRWGAPRNLESPREHFDLGEALGQMDFEAAAKISGARFVVLSGGLARLERAIANLMLDTHTAEFGYREVSPPLLVRDEAVFGTGQLPKFEEDLFEAKGLDTKAAVDFGRTLTLDAVRKRLDKLTTEQIAAHGLGLAENIITEEVKRLSTEHPISELRKRFSNPYWLIPTAEVPLTNLVADQIVDAEALPQRFTAWTPCFRSEAGAAGRDTRGMIRLHQFSKVELVSVTAPEASAAEHERMTDAAETILKKLELPFRTVALCTGDMGFSAEKTYDIEVWLPGQGRYREISSCSNCGAFQARRMKARLRRKGEKGAEFVHTLNGSGLAVGRTLVAILENYQQPDGSVAVPAALQSYMGGLARIEKG